MQAMNRIDLVVAGGGDPGRHGCHQLNQPASTRPATANQPASTPPATTGPIDPSAEWLEADGLGGFASGTVSGVRTRRYHALLLTATTPPAGRMVLVNGFDAWVETPRGTFAISSQRYVPDVIHPDGASRIEFFEYEQWPRWRYKIDDDLIVEQELFVPKGESAVFVSWRMVAGIGDLGLKLKVRPFISGRDFHLLNNEYG